VDSASIRGDDRSRNFSLLMGEIELEILRQLCAAPPPHELDSKTEFFPFIALSKFWNEHGAPTKGRPFKLFCPCPLKP